MKVLLLFTVLLLSLLAVNVSAYSVQFDSSAKAFSGNNYVLGNECYSINLTAKPEPGCFSTNKLASWLSQYNQSRLAGVKVVKFSASTGNLAGAYWPGKDVIVLNAQKIKSRWDIIQILNHETAHAICWQAIKDLSHGSCFKKAMK